MIRNWWKFSCLNAVAFVAIASSAALAADLGLIVNGDVEAESRFAPHGTPGVDHPNGYPDGWHHSANSAWSGTLGGPMSVSPTHSLYLPDTNLSGDGDEEHRSFATAIPGVGTLRDLLVKWKWKWDITSAPGSVFSATVRLSDKPVGGLDLDTSGTVTTHIFNTPTANSGGVFQMFMSTIPVAATDASFDIIFVTGDNLNVGAGTEIETGVMWVDDICAVVPEPATTALLFMGSLGLVIPSWRRRG